MYYNTTNQTGKSLKQCEESTQTQGAIVLGYFENHPCEVLSPSEVWDRLMNARQINPNTPLTSIRRSITDLTMEGKLVKSAQTTTGFYGRKEYQWFLNCPIGQQELI